MEEFQEEFRAIADEEEEPEASPVTQISAGMLTAIDEHLARNPEAPTFAELEEMLYEAGVPISQEFIDALGNVALLTRTLRSKDSSK